MSLMQHAPRDSFQEYHIQKVLPNSEEKALMKDLQTSKKKRIKARKQKGQARLYSRLSSSSFLPQPWIYNQGKHISQ